MGLLWPVFGTTTAGPDAVARQPFGVRWSRNLAGAVGHPMPLRSDNGVAGIAVSLADGSVVLVDSGGRQLWRARLDLPADTGPACGVLRPGEAPVVIATDVWGSVYCFDANGRRLWKHARTSRSGGFRTPVIADLDGDGSREIIVSDMRGMLVCLRADGSVRLEVTAGNYRVSAPVICTPGDGSRHLIFGTDTGDVYRIAADGQLIWACRPGGRFGRSLPVMIGAPGGCEVLLSTSFVGSATGLLRLDAATGALVARTPSEVQAYQSTVVADLNADGTPSVLFGDKNTVLYCLDGHGRKLWATRLAGRGIFHAPAVIGSGHESLILQTVRGTGPDGSCVYALDRFGRVTDHVSLPGGGGSSPLVCRFVGDSELSLITLSAGGVLERRELPRPWNEGRVLWAGPPETPPPLASPVAAPRDAPETKEELEATLGTNTLKASPPPGARYMALLTVQGAKRDLRLTRLGSSARPATHVAVAIGRTGRSMVELSWFGNAPQSRLSIVRYTLTVAPKLGRELAAQTAFEEAVAQATKRAPAFDSLLRHLLHQCRGLYAEARRSMAPDAFDRLRAERERCLAMASLVGRLPAGPSIAAMPIPNPWAALDLTEVMRKAPINAVHISMAGNETESCAFAVVNLTDRPMTVRIERGPFTATDAASGPVPGDRVIRLHEMVAVTPVTTGRPTFDPLPELGEGSVLRLSAGEACPVWLSISSKELAAGEQECLLRIGDTASATPPTSVRVRVRVSSVRLPDRLRYRHCNWLSLAGLRDEAAMERVLRDALDHGTSVFVVPGPTVRLDPSGAAVAVEGALHDWLARRLMGRAFLLISGMPEVAWPGQPPQDTTLRDAGVRTALQAYAAHMRRLGWTTGDYALYLQDEPGLTGPDSTFESFVTLVRQVKAAVPEMGVYANPAGGATASMLEALRGLVDVWCPDMHLFRADPAGLEPIFRSGREWWHYEAPGDQRNLSPLGFYRMQAWVAFRHGMQGAGYWVHSYDPYWFTPPGQSSEYGAVYMTDGHPIASRRWEATRDGIEDYELLSMLKEAAATATGAWADEAHKVLQDAVHFVTAGQENASDIGRQTEPFEPDYAGWMRHRAAVLRALEHAPPRQ
jgi:hypothetical protein